MKGVTEGTHPNNVLDLTDKTSVTHWASDIYYETFLNDMPCFKHVEERKKWKTEGRVADFKDWMIHRYP